MEVLEIEESVLQWDRKLSELSDAPESDTLLYRTHFSEFLDAFSQDVLGQLLNDPYLSEKNEMMEMDLSPASPSPLIQAEHSYSLCGDSCPQSPLTHVSAEDNFGEDLENERWHVDTEPASANKNTESATCETLGLVPSVMLTLAPVPGALPERGDPDLAPDVMAKALTQKVLPKIKLEPHEVDQFLNLCPKEAVDSLHLPPTPPSSHSSDSEGGRSPSRSPPPASPKHLPQKTMTRNASVLSNSPLLTAPHKLQGTGPLMLTEEEKRTLIAEGYPVPTKLPLTKVEEKALKKIRRKIKNKISAQESRRKKKEYMDSLERKVDSCSNENGELRKKVEILENSNRTLLQQLNRLQALVSVKVFHSYKAASTQTCLMVVVLCFAVIFSSCSNSYGPYPSATKTVLPDPHATSESYAASVVRSRNLLIFEESRILKEQHRESISTEQYSSWDRQTDRSLHAVALDSKSRAHAEGSHVTTPNETRVPKSVLLDLQQHRLSSELGTNETLKVIEIDRRINATF
ncbi:cyclic AMP-responsive element-binding protein 3-like protein 2 isoform X2 [Microcaecilia unicolor]|uniref:Cyclic AMP-responsive element-binding protein 3-like protein 2 n=1 Tax=Microcaecilia unicolor TaxID=1415580 RepID=A0A6P7YXD0_9AMPH|nr:cyclic AMP-responsive element-binding protein 3-like protein 2 isoform X2 [Microcaecilia unicolor]